MLRMRNIACRAALLGSAAVIAFALGAAAGWSPAMAAGGEGGQGGARVMAGKSGDHGSGAAAAERGAGKSMKDLFRDVTGESEEEDSDAPAWAGVPGGKSGAGGGKPSSAGAAKGDLFGDLYVILRDENGVPILTPEGFVQPVDADGVPIALDEEGAPVDPTLAIEVELGRLNVGRAPSKVLDRRADEVVAVLNAADEIAVDAAGRLVFVIDGVAKTIDSPLENLAIYVALMTTGTIPGVTDLPGTEYDFLVDGRLTAEDLAASVSFLAAATDKTGEFSVDEVAYIDAFLGINTEAAGDVTWSFIDYSTFSYDRSDAYENVTATVLIEQADGSWAPTTVNVYEAVFDGVDYSGAGSIDVYAQAADDARSIVNYIHEYAIPEDLVSY